MSQEMNGFSKIVAGKRGKWATLLVWLLAAAALGALLPSVNSEETGNAPNLSAAKPSVRAEAVLDREFPAGSSIPALLVWRRSGGLTDDDLLRVRSLTEKLTESPVPHQTSVPPLHLSPPESLRSQASEDGSALVVPVFFEKQADADQLKEGLTELRKRASGIFGHDPFAVKSGEEGELSARATGPVGIQIDATGLFENADASLLIATVVLVLALLLLIYKSPILALIPLAAVGVAYGVISPILGYLADIGAITVDSQGISIMTVLLFGAGTDYCLFLVSRFRQLLRTTESAKLALSQALFGSSGAIAMSGLTVVIALLALLAAEYGAYERFAVPFSIAILVMGLAGLTLVPALLAIFGRGSFFPFVPRTPDMIRERAERKGKPVPSRAPREPRNIAGDAVAKRPWTVAIVCFVLLGGLAVFSAKIEYTYDILSSFPDDMPSREGFATISGKFSKGELAPVKVVVDAQGKETGLRESLSGMPNVDSVSEARHGQRNAQIVAYDVLLNMNPYSMEAMELIPAIRDTAAQALAESGVRDADDRVWIGGQTAEQHDAKATGDRDTRLIIPLVIVLIALLLLVYLRSVVATVYLVLTVILSYLSALGLGWAILHYGMGAEAIQGAIPLYSFVFLVALGEDYNIFMISSIWQKRKTMPLRQAIKEGVGETGSVITSAGLILAGTFAVLATLPIQVLLQFGLITAVGVLLDTFVVRPFLVPAITLLLGKLAFWPGRHDGVSEEPQARPADEVLH